MGRENGEWVIPDPIPRSLRPTRWITQAPFWKPFLTEFQPVQRAIPPRHDLPCICLLAVLRPSGSLFIRQLRGFLRQRGYSLSKVSLALWIECPALTSPLCRQFLTHLIHMKTHSKPSVFSPRIIQRPAVSAGTVRHS